IGWAVASSRTPYAQQPFEIHGTEGSLRIFNTYSFMTGGDDELGPRLEIANSRGKGTKRFPMTPCFRLEIEQFNRSIHGKGDVMTNGEEGLYAQAVTEAVYESVRSGRTVNGSEFSKFTR